MNPEQMALAELYRQARLAVTWREVLGQLPKIDHLPEWLRNDLSELSLATLRVQLIEALRGTEPSQSWDPDDEPQSGDWINITAHPDKFVDWIDETTREEIHKMAAEVLREMLTRRTNTREEQAPPKPGEGPVQ